MDSAIEDAWRIEYREYVGKAAAQRVSPVLTFEQYQAAARRLSQQEQE
jgi:hypothetical protein